MASALLIAFGCDSQGGGDESKKALDPSTPLRLYNESIEQMNLPTPPTTPVVPPLKPVTAVHPPESEAKPPSSKLSGPISDRGFFSTKDTPDIPAMLTPLPLARPSGSSKVVKGILPKPPAVLPITRAKHIFTSDSNSVQIVTVDLTATSSSSADGLQDNISSLGGQVVPIPPQTDDYEQYIFVVSKKQFAELQERLIHVGVFQLKPLFQASIEDAKAWLFQSEEANLSALKRLRDELDGNKAGDSEPAKETKAEITKMQAVVDALHRVNFEAGSTLIKLTIEVRAQKVAVPSSKPTQRPGL